jgi:hypothetical protein
MTAMGYISDTEEIVKASWSVFQHDGAVAFKLSDRSPLPLPFSASNLPGGRTQILNVRRIRSIHRYPVEIEEDNTPESISNTVNWLNINGDLHNPVDSDDDCTADVESTMEQDRSIGDLECPEQRDVSTAPNVPE